ncbi:hypothetical protein C8Q80DRAFT_391726 [Daedaleopsis nitida]|nr:hypothetical protein C8Q80DRAFT_391726 [Daedaleopsis nitida]
MRSNNILSSQQSEMIPFLVQVGFDQNRCIAAKDRRLPDMTSMVFFKTIKVAMDGKQYLLKTQSGPKLVMTEVKSFGFKANEELDTTLRFVLRKAHLQNETAAMWLFFEYEKLQKVASFVGVGPAWSYGEFGRFGYHDLRGKPWSNTPGEVKDFEEREYLDAHRKERKRPSKKRRRHSNSTERASYTDSSYDDAEYQPQTEPSSHSINNAITAADGGENDHRIPPTLGSHAPLPAAALAPIFGGSVFLYILNREGRTRKAFDTIVERIRGWYSDRDDDYKLTFDADPHTRS